MIGGNIDLQLQTKKTAKDEIGAKTATWTTVQTIHGWLDYSSGEANIANFDAKVKETTDFFISDYVPVSEEIDEETCRAVVNGKAYDVLLIDNPMGMNRQLEIYLKYTGGQ